jgi:hypothetical protein
MKTQLNIQELAAQINSNMQAKHDYIQPTKDVDLQVLETDTDKKIIVDIGGHGFFDITDNAHQQIAAHADIPRRYYNRLLMDSPELLIDNVHHWFRKSEGKRMMRTMDQRLRAFMSDRYRRIDNEHVANAVFPILAEQQNIVVMSCAVTEKKLYMKLLFPDIQAEVKPGDVMRAGVMVSNSEIGHGSLSIQYFMYRDYCTNGCVFGKSELFGLSRSHIGKRLIEGDDFQIISDETMQKEDDLILSQVGDVMRAATDMSIFNGYIDKMREATSTPVLNNPVAAVELIAKDITLTEMEKEKVLVNLLEDRDYSKYGVLNAVTKVANTHESYDRATELETMGSLILDLNQAQWNKFVNAETVAA